MMLLEEFKESLATVLIKYYDYQHKENKLTKTAAVILSQSNLSEELDLITNKCTAERQSLLTYIKNLILELDAIHKRKTPFSAEELKRYEQFIEQTLLNFQSLMALPKNKDITLEYKKIDESNETIKVNGLYSDNYFYPGLCFSGVLVKTNIFDGLSIVNNTAAMKYFNMALCQSHQTSLLTAAKKTLVSQESQTNEVNEAPAHIQKSPIRGPGLLQRAKEPTQLNNGISNLLLSFLRTEDEDLETQTNGQSMNLHNVF